MNDRALPVYTRLALSVKSRRFVEGAGILACSTLLALSYPPSDLGATAFVALVPWLTRFVHPGSRAASGAAVGTLAGLWIGRWIPAGLDALGTSAVVGLPFLALMAFVFSGLPWAVVGYVSGRPTSAVGRALSLIVACVVIDLLRLFVPFAGTWSSIGHSQIQNAGVSQLAVLGGGPALSLIVVAVNAQIALAWERRTRPSLRFALALVVAVSGMTVVGLRAAEALRDDRVPDARVLVVQSSVPFSERWARTAQRTVLRRVQEQTRRSLAAGEGPVDLVVWPEMVVTTPLESSPDLAGDFRSASKLLGVPLVAGFARVSTGPEGDYRNSVGWFDPVEGLVSTVDKAVAIPLVESGRAFPGSGIVSQLLGAGGWGPLRVAEVDGPGRLVGAFDLAVAICYEIQFPRLVQERHGKGVTALVNVSNDGWLGSETLSRIQLAFARLRAVEQRSYVIRATDTGVSAVVNPYGIVQAEVPFGEEGVVRGAFGATDRPAASERLGLAGTFLTLFLVGWLSTFAIWRTR